MSQKGTVLVTGGGSGIGREICKRFYEEGYSLIVVSLVEDELLSLKKELYKPSDSQTLNILAVDLTDDTSIQKVEDYCDSLGCHVDILVNNAGFGLHDRHVDLDLKQLNSMLSLNIIAVSQLCHVFANRMIKTQMGSSNTPKGTIINIGSTSAFQPLPMLAAYAASKSFIVSFTEALASELAEEDIRVHCVCPGTTKTPFLDVAGLGESTQFGSTAYIAHKIAMSPKDVADLTFNIIGSQQVTAVPGIMNKVHYQMMHWLPNKLMQPVVNLIFKR